MSDDKAIAYLVDTFRSFLNGENISNLDSSVCDSIENEKLKELLGLVGNALLSYNNATQAIKSLSEGNLDFEIASTDQTLLPIKTLQSKLIESQQKLQLITDHSIDVIWMMDFDSQKFTFMSPSVYKLRGLTVEEAMSESFEQSMTPESAIKAHQKITLLHTIIQNNEQMPDSYDEYQQWCKNGQIIDIEVGTNLIFDQDGKPKEILGISRDITDRKKAERTLKESEEKYRLITENTKDIIWKIDIEKLRYNYISPSITQLTGHTPEEVLNHRLIELITPQSYEKMVQLIQERLKLPFNPESNIRERFQIYTKDGKIVDVEAIASFIRDQNGEPIEILGVSRDITERIRIEEELNESHKKLALLLEHQSNKNRQLQEQLQYIYNNASNAIAFFDLENGIMKFSSCNKRWANSIGYEPEELEGFDISKMPDTETALLYRRFMDRAIEARHPIEEYVYWHNMHLHVIVIPIVNEQTGKITSCGAFIFNLTEKIEADQKIRESDERFFSIFNNSKDAIVLLSMQLEIVNVNEAFFRIYKSPDYPKQNILESFFPPEYHTIFMEQLNYLKEGVSIPSFECGLYDHFKVPVPVEISTSVIMVEQSPMLLCIIRDITVRKEMERMLTRVGTQIETRERRKLAADLHDNVGPLLSSMNMYLSVLSRKDELKPYAETMADIRRILKDTISSVREISNNLSPQVLANFGLTAAINQFFETKKKLIIIKITNTLGDIRFSEIKETMIFNVIIEVFNNSLKYSEATVVQLNISEKNGSVNVEYSDNGIGFNLEEKMGTISNNLGLFSIINRVKILEGNYMIETSPGNGFLLKIVFPINNY